MGTTRTDPAARPEVTAAALAKAAIQTTQRALFTAQLAADAMATAAYGKNQGDMGKQLEQDAASLNVLRDALLDAFRSVPEETRKRLSACRASLTSDELIDLLALSVQG